MSTRRTSIPPLKRANLRETVLAQIRSAIISGDLAPGEEFSAPSLAREFGVSATPVREAMLELSRQGLVEVLRNRGFRVTEMSEATLVDITNVRMLLEPPAVASICQEIPVTDLPLLRSQAQVIIDAAQAADIPKYLEGDMAFHLGLLRRTGNDTLVDIISDLRAQTRQFGLRELIAAGTLPDNAREHMTIVDHIADRDPEAVRSLLTRHIRHAMGVWAGHEEPEGTDDGI